MNKYILALLPVALLMPGCATITRGTSSQVTITSDPSPARVTTSLSQACTTPCTLTVGRKDEFIVRVESPGYQPVEIPVTTKIAGNGALGFAGNVVAGGVIGMGVDAATGSTLEHTPNPVHAVLVPLSSSSESAKPAKKTRSHKGPSKQEQ